MKIGIAGANGQLGRLVVESLKRKVATENLVALVRTPQKVLDLGIEARIFDYEKPEDLVESLQGVDYLLLISSNEIGKRKEQHNNVINASKQAGIKWIIYTSVLHADKSSLSLAEEHLGTEVAIKASGIAYTILRNGWYTENYFDSISGALEAGILIGSAGEGKISAAPREDYAEAAAVVLTSKNKEGIIYELAGDGYFTLTDLAAEISSKTGRDIPYKNLPEREYVEVLKSSGFPEEVAKAIVSYDIATSKNALFDNSMQLSQLIGRPTISLAQSIKEYFQLNH